MATTTVHTPDKDERHHRTILAVKFHGQPSWDEPGSGRRTLRLPPPWVARFLCFPAISDRHIPLFHHFWTLLTPLCGHFLQIHHRLKDTTKPNSANCWIEFSGHHSNLWTKVRVLMCSWSLGISIDMWFVNFGCRLVSFPFLGCFG